MNDPDRYCVTQEDGSYVSEDPRCMHQAPRDMFDFLEDAGRKLEHASRELGKRDQAKLDSRRGEVGAG